MRIKDIKKQINNINLLSSNFDSVVSKINNNEGVILKMEKKQKEKKSFGFVGIVSFAMTVIVCSLFGFNYYSNNKAKATINFDVNPSIELQINKKDKILAVKANNEEGKIVLGTMDLEGSSLEIGVNAIMGSMLKNGYISEIKNSVILSVVGDNKEENEKLRSAISKEIEALLESSSITASVISQSVEGNSEIKDLATKYDISVGRANLINKIVKENPQYTFENLYKLSANELSLLISSKKSVVTDVEVTGSASDKSYIGKESAKSIVFKSLNISSSNVKELEVEMDYESGKMVYDVEFKYNNFEYDYEVDATSGKILNSNRENDSDDDEKENYNSNKSEETNKNYISKSKAKKIALNSAGVSKYTDFEIEFEYKSGKAIYEVSFETTSKEYDYDIDATTGKILWKKITNEVENDNDHDEDDHDEDDHDEDD